MDEISVLMTVYEGQEHVGEAIRSILNQSYSNYQFVIINDGSTDRTLEIIESYKDRRISLLNNKRNIGLTESLNKGLEAVRGKYIARMDADDISHPDRLRTQVDFMDANPDIGICGTWVETIGDRTGEEWCYPIDDAAIRCRLLFESAFAHPSVMIRGEILRNDGINFDPAFKCAQDYDLWVKLSDKTRMANIPRILLKRRMHRNQIGQAGDENQRSFAKRVRMAQLAKLGIKYSSEELDLHHNLGLWQCKSTRSFVLKADEWLRKLQMANRMSGVYPEPEFSRMLGHRWLITCCKAKSLGPWTLKRYFASPLCRTIPANLKEAARLRSLRFVGRICH